MTILVVEDDHLQLRWVVSELQQEFPNAEINEIRTEYEFNTKLTKIAKSQPDIILMDIMLPWTEPSPEMPEAPYEVEEQGFYRAGFRCQKLLNENEKTRDIPILLYTVLSKDDLKTEIDSLSPNVMHLQKSGHPKEIFAKINYMLRGKSSFLQ